MNKAFKAFISSVLVVLMLVSTVFSVSAVNYESNKGYTTI